MSDSNIIILYNYLLNNDNSAINQYFNDLINNYKSVDKIITDETNSDPEKKNKEVNRFHLLSNRLLLYDLYNFFNEYIFINDNNNNNLNKFLTSIDNYHTDNKKFDITFGDLLLVNNKNLIKKYHEDLDFFKNANEVINVNRDGTDVERNETNLYIFNNINRLNKHIKNINSYIMTGDKKTVPYILLILYIISMIIINFIIIYFVNIAVYNNKEYFHRYFIYFAEVFNWFIDEYIIYYFTFNKNKNNN